MIDNWDGRVVIMNRKGQALVEFILILPVFILILLVIVDFGNILYSKNQMESSSTDIVRIILNGQDVSELSLHYPDYDISFTDEQNQYRKIEIVQKIKVITPFLDRILGNPCVIKTERIIPFENGEMNDEDE